MGRCPTCNKPSGPLESNPSAPFCSARCKTIDLGKWLDGAYRVPTQESPPGEGEGSEGDGNKDTD